MFLGNSVNLHGKEGLRNSSDQITLHNILEYMQIAMIQTEAADFVKMNICVILNFWPRLYITLDLTFTDPTLFLGSHIQNVYFMFAVTHLVHVEIYFISIENFCNSTSKDGFSFPRTTVGWSAYSEELCDEKTTSSMLLLFT
jgi:hypothetical protein